jgi:ketosteroid isomerase-like protein
LGEGRKVTKNAWISGVFLGIAMVCSATLTAQAKTSDEAAIKALEARLMAAVTARDVDKIMQCYDPGEALFVFDVIPPREYVGASAYRKDWEGFLGGFKGPIKMELTDLDVVTDGKLAFGHNVQHMVATDKDGKPVDIVFRVTDGYRKVHGKWLIAEEHVSVPVDLSTGKADLQSKPGTP